MSATVRRPAGDATRREAKDGGQEVRRTSTLYTAIEFRKSINNSKLEFFLLQAVAMSIAKDHLYWWPNWWSK